MALAGESSPIKFGSMFEVKDAAEIEHIVGRIAIDEKRSGGHCMCCGEPSFEFYKDEELVAMVGFHHGRSIRWLGGWPGDGMLTPQLFQPELVAGASAGTVNVSAPG